MRSLQRRTTVEAEPTGHQGPAEPMELGSMLLGEEEPQEDEEEYRLNAISPGRRDSRA
jgi:hypothetical protein